MKIINILISYKGYFETKHKPIPYEGGMDKNLIQDAFKKYRRSWDIAPPPMSEDDNNKFLFSPLNGSIPLGMVPFTESLKNTYDRVIPYYEKEIKKQIQENKNILISAHGNSYSDIHLL